MSDSDDKSLRQLSLGSLFLSSFFSSFSNIYQLILLNAFSILSTPVQQTSAAFAALPPCSDSPFARKFHFLMLSAAVTPHHREAAAAASAAGTRPPSKALPSTADSSVLHPLIRFTCGLCADITASGAGCLRATSRFCHL